MTLIALLALAAVFLPPDKINSKTVGHGRNLVTLSFLPFLFLSAFFLSFFWHDMNSFLIIDELRTWLPSSIDSDFILETQMLNKCWWLEWNPIGTKFVSTEQCYGTCLHLKYQWCIMGGVCLKSELYSLWPSVHKTTVTNSHNTESLSCFFLSSLCKNVCQSYPSTTLPWMYQACKDPPPSLSLPLFPSLSCSFW